MHPEDHTVFGVHILLQARELFRHSPLEPRNSHSKPFSRCVDVILGTSFLTLATSRAIYYIKRKNDNVCFHFHIKNYPLRKTAGDFLVRY